MTRVFTIALAVTLLVVACGKQDEAAVPQASQVPADWDRSLAEPALLVNTLPGNTQAYLRLPSPWNLLMAPKANALAPALASGPNRQAIATLQHATRAQLERDFGAFGASLALLLEGLRSPLEIAVLGDERQPMSAELVVSARLAMDSVELLNDELAQLAGRIAVARLVSRASDEAPGHLLIGPVALHYRFDHESSRLLAVAGMQASAARLAEVQAWPQSEAIGLHRMEQSLDVDRQGLLLWANGPWLQMAIPQGMAGMPVQQRDLAQEWGLAGIDELGLGYGVAGGRGNMGLMLRGGEGAFWDRTLPAADALVFETAGEPRLVIGWRLPDYHWWLAMAEAIVGAEQVAQAVETIDTELHKEIGLRLEDLAAAMAGRYFYIEDDNGAYVLRQAADMAALERLLTALQGHFDLRWEKKRVAGRQLNHLVIPSLPAESESEAVEAMGADPVLAYLLGQALRVSSHVYWVEEQGDLLMASVPQILTDRARFPARNSLEHWLSGHGRSSEQALLLAAGRTRDNARRNYYNYLQLLQAAADLLAVPLDLTEFPSARELALAESGQVSAQLDFAERSLGLRLSFDHHPGDLLSGRGGLMGVAAIGVVAAVAIPAYQDYTVRAQIAARMTEAASLRLTIDEHFQAHGALPSGEQAEQLGVAPENDPDLYYDAEQKVIFISLGDLVESQSDAWLVLQPNISQGQILRWDCQGISVASKLLPSQCRGWGGNG